MNNRVHIIFQPIFDAKTMQIFAYEGLMRFSDTNIIEVIKRCNTYVDFYEIEKLTFFETFKEYQKRNLREKLFINSFPNIHLNQSDLLSLMNQYSELLRKTVIEILEYPKLDSEVINKKKTGLKNYSIDFAIDDYGINTFENLQIIAPKYLKIDRSIISGIHQDLKKQEQLQEIIKIAKKYACLTIAEGIETVADLDYLRKQRIDYFQGFLLGKPV